LAEAGETIQTKVTTLRRAHILDAAATVFAQRGFHRATIRDIATAASVADGTIYTYFDNKTALLFGLLHRLNETDARDHALAPLDDMNLRAFLEQYFQHRLAVLTQGDLNVFQVICSEVLVNPELRARYLHEIVARTFALAERHFAALVESGRLPPVDIPLFTCRLFEDSAF
jgi:TetR/AcrR family fatty acid metabolism transcriptional regulator